ncbi:coproporphyrinogen III oxidase [Bacteroidia bacterium]|nr:coproporphyrinogen III oxidase [Bacteroidia bacterium]
MGLYKDEYLHALLKEMEMRKGYLEGEALETIYLGGGTPSQLDDADLRRIFDTIYHLFEVKEDAEITLEANPDDMTTEYVSALKALPVNRISMGIQSFDDADLRFLNRRHTRKQAIEAVGICRENGYENISIDLIYGLPGQTPEQWEENLREAIKLDVPHLSAYHLTYEEGTPIYRMKEEGRILPVEEDVSVALFDILIDRLTDAGYMHYEISNFAKPGRLSRHNSSYWTGKRYLGVGPSAHSYNLESRQWNVSSLAHYIYGLRFSAPDYEIETLNIHNKYNDYILTKLRTCRGVSLSSIKTIFGEAKYAYFLKQANQFILNGMLSRTDDKVALTRKGLFISDGIISDLLWVNFYTKQGV